MWLKRNWEYIILPFAFIFIGVIFYLIQAGVDIVSVPINAIWFVILFPFMKYPTFGILLSIIAIFAIGYFTAKARAR